MELEKPRDPTDVRKNFNAWSHGDRHGKLTYMPQDLVFVSMFLQISGMMNPEKKAFTVEELKWALKEMKEDINDKPEETEGPKQPSEGLRTYAELKKDFETMNAGMKTDLEIIRDLINEYRQPGCTDSRKLDILNDFEYYVHQVRPSSSVFFYLLSLALF